MKKLLAIILSSLLIFSFAACSCSSDPTEDKTAEETAEETAEVTNEVIEDKPVKIPEPPKPIEAKLTRGKVEGQKYTSDYTGLNFTAPEGWEYSSDVAMAELLNMGAEMLSEEKIAQTLTNTSTVFDMIATDKTNGNNVSISYENINYICGKSVEIDEYVKILKDRVGNQMQVEYEFKDEAKVTLSGEEYQRVVVSINANSFRMTQAYYIRIIEDVAVRIETTLIGDTTVKDIEAMFK